MQDERLVHSVDEAARRPGRAEAVNGRWAVLVGPESRILRRQLGALTCFVLEDVALDAAMTRSGLMVAGTSARQVAANLGIEPEVASNALRRLRSHGLLDVQPVEGPAARFGLSAYVVVPTAGIELVPVTKPSPQRRSRAATAKPAQLDLLHPAKP